MQTEQPIFQRPITLSFATFLSSKLYSTYEYIASYIGEQVGCPATLVVGQTLHDFKEGTINIGFVCGLLYVHMSQQTACPVELLAAPVLYGERYQNRPIYFSDVVVRSESAFTCFDDLQGCTWAYNEEASHSGWNLVRYSLYERGNTLDYFGSTVKSGSHLHSLLMVLEGTAHATAIDSHLLAVVLRQYPYLASRLRIIAALGPSAIPPLVISKTLDASLKASIQAALLSMHLDPHARKELRKALIKRFAPVTDEHYRDIRHMYATVQAKAYR